MLHCDMRFASGQTNRAHSRTQGVLPPRAVRVAASLCCTAGFFLPRQRHPCLHATAALGFLPGEQNMRYRYAFFQRTKAAARLVANKA